MEGYNHKEIEKKWQERWEKDGLYNTPDKIDAKENFYTLVEFPYPSGNLHVGHWYAFAVPDIFARFKRMQGFNVLYPIGFDSFGLPAENAAIKRGLDPKEWTYSNIEYMSGQLKSMGNMFDWSRKVMTSDPEYYKWTQWLFIELFKKGLAYKKKGLVNWCPSCQTVLANEQVVDGTCERCGTEVTKKDLEQWYFKITDYAERLLEDLEGLDWPEPIKQSQRNWIGKSEGVIFTSPVKDMDLKIQTFSAHFEAFKADTFVVIAPDHPLLKELVKNTDHEKDVLTFAQSILAKRSKDKYAEQELEGIFTGRYIVDPVGNGELPIWVASYALADYGTGIVKCSAHDERDFAFAKKYNIPLKVVLFPDDESERTKVENQEICYTNMQEGVLIEPAEFKGKRAGESRSHIIEYLESHNLAERQTTYKLRDWLLSRQRYWGCPIPVVYDPEGKPHPIPEEHLPWVLPTDDIDYTPKGTSPLGSSKELIERTEKIFGEGWRPEVDTMDTFVDSSWYFLRYCDPDNTTVPFDKLKVKNWMPVKRYSGGAEHTTMHLLYARFFHKALFDLKLVDEGEPFSVRMNRGLILGPDGQKMSKSKGNVVDPGPHVERVGSDTVKTYLAFIGPYNEVGQYPWDLGGIAGVRRFLERVWKLKEIVIDTHEDEADIQILTNKTIKKVTEDTENYKFNTAISQMMILVNELEKQKKVSKHVYEDLLRLLAPCAPHMTEELWEQMGNTTSIHLESWPIYDEGKLFSDMVTYAIQINGKVRGELSISRGAPEKGVVEQAQNDSAIKGRIEGKKVLKIVFVKERLINFVIEI